MDKETAEDQGQVNTGGGTYVEEGVETQGDFIGRDSTVLGDQVRGDKVGGDKIGHDKISGQIGDVGGGAQVAIGIHNQLVQQQATVEPFAVEGKEIERLLKEAQERFTTLTLSQQQTILVQYHLKQLQNIVQEIGGRPHVQA